MENQNCFRGHIVDLVARRIFDGELMVRDGKIASVTECEVEASAPYYMPGFIDSHVHIEMNGGVAVSDGTGMEDLPLPIGGIISPLCGHELAFRCQLLHEMIQRAGCGFRSPFITLAFMCLPVIPQLKLTDRGLFRTA